MKAAIVQGKYEIVSDIVFTPEGKRTERVVRAPDGDAAAHSPDAAGRTGSAGRAAVRI